MFGPFLVAISGMLAVLTLRLKRHVPGRRLFGRWAGWTAALILVPMGVMILIVVLMLLMPQGREFLEGIRRVPFVQELVGDSPWPSVVGSLLLVKLRTWVMPVVVAGMAGLCAVLLVQRSVRDAGNGSRGDLLSHSSVRFALLCAIFGLLLTLSVEFVYLVDVFRVRMNTIFKFYFQAWILMALASAFAVYWLGRTRDWLRVAFLVVFWMLFAMGMVYPVFGNAARAGMFDHAPRLDGTAYLAESKPEDYAAVTWLNEHVDGTPLILEAPGSGGSSYVYEGRVSALTGLPTLLGWAGHEGQWRGSYTIQEARDPDIKTIYNTLDLEVAQSLLDSYDISYVYVGPVERGKYDARALDKFQRFMDVVYDEGGVTIYKARN
jgi:YYY domain-containing protein